MTREEHREAYEAHKIAAADAYLALEKNRVEMRDGDRVTTYKAVHLRPQLVDTYHDELTAASAHLALAMILEGVE